MKKKLYISSDEHGDYKALMQAEKDAGYDENNPNHFRISLSDCFDRGRDSLTIYEYYKRLCDEGKMIVLNGNHFPMLANYLDGTSISRFNFLNNGLDTTLDDLTHRTHSFESWCLIDEDCEMSNKSFAKWIGIARKEINEEYSELLPWLKERPWYYETKNYIFCHYSIDTEVPDWHYPHCEKHRFTDWEALSWGDATWVNKPVKNTSKIIVGGHFSTRELRKISNIDLENPDQDGPLYIYNGEGKLEKIFIDTCTARTHKVNVLVLEDELLDENN